MAALSDKMTDDRALEAIKEAMNYAPMDLRDKAWLGYAHLSERLSPDEGVGKTRDIMLTEQDLEEIEKLVSDGTDAAWREREAIERLIAEVRRLWQQA